MEKVFRGFEVPRSSIVNINRFRAENRQRIESY